MYEVRGKPTSDFEGKILKVNQDTGSHFDIEGWMVRRHFHFPGIWSEKNR